jgi:putative hydrolase of the HAD superfamily
MKIQAIGFDADDTLWHNEDHFRATEESFADLVSPWASAEEAAAVLLRTETVNLELFGYGVKSFTLSMIEAAMELSRGEVAVADLSVLIDRGKAMLAREAEILPGVEETLAHLSDRYRLIVITKGDLHHQERKVALSGLSHHFASVEVVSEKDEETYARILGRHDVAADRFVMIGNSKKSDILPPVQLGAVGVHIPYRFTWAHEHVADDGAHAHLADRIYQLDSIHHVPDLIASLHRD